MRWLLVAVVAVVVTGCGSGETADDKVRAEMAKVQTTCAPGANCAADSPRPFRKCTGVSRGFRACSTFFARDRRSAIYRRDGGRWRIVGRDRSSRATQRGLWAGAPTAGRASCW
jgi:hypothetical protein